MKSVLTVLSALTLLSGVAFAEDTKPAAPASPAKPAEAPAKPGKGEDLHGLMKAIGGDFGKLSKSLDDASAVDANRARLKTLIANAEKCRALIPAKTEKQPEAERPKFVEDYKTEIDKLIADFKKIDAALEKKDFAAAKAAAADCNALKKDDHRKFIQKK